MTPRKQRLHSVMAALRQYQRQGCRFSLGPGGTEVRVEARTKALCEATRGLIDGYFYDVLSLLHEVERQQTWERRCAWCHDRIPQRRLTHCCRSCDDGADGHKSVTFRRLDWLAYEVFDAPCLIARFN